MRLLLIGFIAFVVVALAVLALLAKDPILSRRPKRLPPLKADPQLLRRHVERLSRDFFPRSIFQPETLERVADFIRDELKSDGLEVTEDSYIVPEMGKMRYRIVRASLAGTTTDRRPIVVGAHYDAITATPGADDNASAVAALLELGRLLAKSPAAIPIELVAYPNEESPSFGSENMGSYRHARALREQGQAIRGMLSLEMLGYYRSEAGTQAYPLRVLRLLYPSRGNFIVFASNLANFPLVHRGKRFFAEASDFPVESFVGPESIAGLMNSDHSSYIRLGFPAFMVTDTAYYRNPNYHTPHDVSESLDYAAMARVVEGLYGMLLVWK